MVQFDYTVTLGNVLTTLTLLSAFVGGAWKLIANHLNHLEKKIVETAATVKTSISEHQELELQFFNQRFTTIETDIREIREHLRKVHERTL